MKKAHLPHKICPVCQRSFAWRKKWELNWDQVTYCSRRCRGMKNLLNASRSSVPSNL